MNCKPILFCASMLQAIDEDRKTQTRRIIGQNIIDSFLFDNSGNLIGSYTEDEPEAYPTIDDCPVQGDDILWVRETFYQFGEWYTKEITDKNGEKKQKREFVPCGLDKPIFYFDTLPEGIQIKRGYKSGRGYYKRPSIFMPRYATRRFLCATEVRAERLQDITLADVLAEGIRDDELTYKHNPNWSEDEAIGVRNWISQYARFLYQKLWDSLNAKRDGGKWGWYKNPWVWVYTFEKCAKPENWPEAA